MIKYLENAADFKEIISKGTVLVDFTDWWSVPNAYPVLKIK